MAFGDADIPTFFADADSAVLATTPDPTTIQGFLEYPEELDHLGGLSPQAGAIASRARFTCSATYYGLFVKNMALTCKSQTFAVRDWRRIDDGQVMVVQL